MFYYQISIPVSLHQLYTYRSEEKILSGCRVVVSFGQRLVTGIVWNKTVKPDLQRIKRISEVIDEKPIYSPLLLKLAKWMEGYYKCPLGLVLSAMIPSGAKIEIIQKVRIKDISKIEEFPILKELSLEWSSVKELRKKHKNKSILKQLHELEDLDIIEFDRKFTEKIKNKKQTFIKKLSLKSDTKLSTKQADFYFNLNDNEIPLNDALKLGSRSVLNKLIEKKIVQKIDKEIDPYKRESEIIKQNIILNKQQSEALNTIITNIVSTNKKPLLLYGITGSGKTEVYIRSIKKVLSENKTALMLVPEISLTPQMVQRFYSAFNCEIAVLHSNLTTRQRWEEWQRIKQKNVRIVIGARSAIFANLENLGIIIVDEEHEGTYKQDNNPRYNARDLAIIRGINENATIVLGSATPSLESWNNVQNGKYEYLELSKRAKAINLPKVKIIDLKTVEQDQLLSDELAEKIKEKLEKKEQIILFQNRRGFSSFVQCVSCGLSFKCPNCEVTFSYHKNSDLLQCHHCGYVKKIPRKCPKCGGYSFNFGAAGTQRIEKVLNDRFPSARVMRMDADTTKQRDSYDKMFVKMNNHEIDILIGTQMIAKGLDFPNVTLVGVVQSDISLNIPDFRAGERTFQLLTQVAGRSGRGDKKGEVIIQTYNPDHYVLKYAMKQDYKGFSAEELQYRKMLKYPPFYRMARLIFSSENEQALLREMNKVKTWINQQNLNEIELMIMGPIDPPLSKVNRKFKQHIILKALSNIVLSNYIDYFRENWKLASQIKLLIDVDPMSLM